MEDLSTVLEGIASLLWPLIVLFVIIKFHGPVKEIIESAKKRKFTVKVGEYEISMEEVSEQFRAMLKDLQNGYN